MLKLYTDKTFLVEAYRKYTFPLLFDLHYVKNIDTLKYYKIINNVEVCDIIVYPIDYKVFCKHSKPFKTINEYSKKYNKPIWIYTAGDYGYTPQIPNSYIFRFGGFHSKLNTKNYILGAFISDPYEYFIEQKISLLPKQIQPTIGFVGHAQSGFKKYLKECLNYLKYSVKRILKLQISDYQSFYPSSVKRAKYLRKLQSIEVFNTNFIFRKNYRGGALTPEDRKLSSIEFYNNIYNNLYTFCSRGVGNFSVRFYETLAVGRIPILLNTDCRLPLSSIIDWEKHIVILDESSKESLEKQILKFHNTKTPTEIEEIQKSNRQLWEQFLTRESFFIQFYKIFKSKIE